MIMSKEKLSKEFMMALANYHNPETIFKMANTDWEKAVAIEFYFVKKKQDNTDNEIKWLKYLVKSVFVVGCTGIGIQVITKLFGL